MDSVMSETFLKICGTALLFVTVSFVMGEGVRSGRFPFKLCGAIVLYGGVLLLLLPLIEELRGMTESRILTNYSKTMLKALGIALLSELVSGICRDSGEGTVGSMVEMAGKAVILLLALPLIRSLIETVEGLL